ncbi:MAG: ABC transporter ATP-binding protein [Candidatus Zixiibacteriota bacterium]|nr:MAG: ABC transporter ATP-binding protein [candidate division Zixibacteria bacterium]
MANDYREEDKLGKGYDSKLMSRLLQYLKPYRRYVALAITLLVISSAFGLAGPYLVKIAIDNYITASDFGGLQQIALIYLLFLFVQFFTDYGQLYIMEWIGQHAMFDLRRQLFAHVQSMHLQFFDKNPSGRLLTRVTTDVNALNELFASGVVEILGNLLQLVGVMAAMYYISPRLALATFVIMPLIVIVTMVFRKRVREAYRQIRIIIARLNAYTQEHLAGMSEVHAFVQEEKTMNRYRSINNDLRTENQKSIYYYAVFFPVVELIGALSAALILWYGGGSVVRNVVTVGTLVAFLQYVEMFFRPMRDLAERYNILQAAMAASERIFKVLDTEPEIVAPVQTQTLKGFKGDIEFEHVDFSYDPGNLILHDINFRVKPGEKIALVGATGAGKTSTVGLLCRFYDVNSGRIKLNGIDINQLDPNDLRSAFGLVSQEIFLFSGSIKDNISLGADDISDEQVTKAAEQVGLLPFINRLERRFEHGVGERGTSLSVGQRQLISFARALARNPKVLILDEATSSVDNETEQIIQQALRKMFEGRTSVIVAHRLSTIKEADKILVFHKGRIVEQGKHEDLLRQKGVYWRLYQLQYQDQEAV